MDWYRKKSWDKSDEEHFFQKLSRARKDNRAQYLKIQGIELMDTKKPELLEVAEMLLENLLTEYPEDKFNRSSTFKTLGEIYKLRGNNEKAIEYFKKAIDFEKEYPNVQTGAYLDYAELIIKMDREGNFEEVENLLTDKLETLMFPNDKYISYSILSYLNSRNGFENLAAEYAELAEMNATAETSGFRYHKNLGVVKNRNNFLDKLVKGRKNFG